MPASESAAPATFVAPADWRAIDLISDLHLAPDTPRSFEAWAAHLRYTDADAVFMLGDLFEVWVGDDARRVGFERECADVLADAARARTLGFMAGNRDFLLGAEMLAECRMIALADPTLVEAFGTRALLSHGDALCLADVEYQRFRAEVRSDAWRERFLALPLDERRTIARHLRDASEARRRTAPVPNHVDIDTALATRWLECAGAGVLVHGHTHRPATSALPGGRTRHVLSDWDLDGGVPRAEVLRWTRGGFARIAPAVAG